MVSAAILIYAAVELIILPYVAQWLVKAGIMSPAAAGAWMGLSVKTDGAATASAEIVTRYVGVALSNNCVAGRFLALGGADPLAISAARFAINTPAVFASVKFAKFRG